MCAENEKDGKRVEHKSEFAGSAQNVNCADCLFGDENIKKAYWLRLEYCVDEEHFDRVRAGESRPLSFEIKAEPNATAHSERAERGIENESAG